MTKGNNLARYASQPKPEISTRVENACATIVRKLSALRIKFRINVAVEERNNADMTPFVIGSGGPVRD